MTVGKFSWRSKSVKTKETEGEMSGRSESVEVSPGDGLTGIRNLEQNGQDISPGVLKFENDKIPADKMKPRTVFD